VLIAPMSYVSRPVAVIRQVLYLKSCFGPSGIELL
jgi:hypothetical protein